MYINIKGCYEAKNQSSGKSINGIIEAFPKELIGIVPVKQYLEAVGNINYSGIKNFKKLSTKHIIIGFVFFFLPIIILAIVDIFRWNIYRKKIKCKLTPIIENINKTMVMVDVEFKIDISIFGNIKLWVLFNENNECYRKELMPTETIKIDGFDNDKILLLEPTSSRLPTIQNIICCKKKRDSVLDHLMGRLKEEYPNDKKLIIKSKSIRLFKRNIRGWSNKYYNELYNFMSVKEFNEMINDYNGLCEYDTFNNVCLAVYISTAFLTITIIGLVFWALTWEYYVKEYIRYYESIKLQRKNLHIKYNRIYGSRGFRICDDPILRDVSVLSISDSKGSRSYTTYSNEIDLFIYVSRDVGDGPVLTTLLPSKQLLLAPTISGVYNPKSSIKNNTSSSGASTSSKNY